MPNPTTIRITEHSSRAEIEQAIVELRAKAVRWSRQDPRRDEVDSAVDQLVDQWLTAE